MHPDVRPLGRCVFALIAVLSLAPPSSAQLSPPDPLAALPPQNFTTSRGIGILEDDGASYWPGFPANFQAPATYHLTPTGSGTYSVQRVPFAFDDPSGGTVLLDGAVRPIVNFLDANYVRYTLAAPFPFAGKQYTVLNISSWGSVAFGEADSSQVNYDPTVMSSMFHIPMVAVWYELLYYPSGARIVAKAKPHSAVITWQNAVGRHSTTPCNFQIELFDSGEMQLSYQTLAADHGLVGINHGSEITPARQSATPLASPDLPPHLQIKSATFDDYGGVEWGVTLTLNAPIPARAPGEAFIYSLSINEREVAGIEVGSTGDPFFVGLNTLIPALPIAQINSWGTTIAGDTMSFRMPATSLEPYLITGSNSWMIVVHRFGGAGAVNQAVTHAAPLNFAVRHSLLPADVGTTVEIPPIVFHYMPGIWDTDRIRESIAAYLASRGQNVDTFRFFPTVYDEGMKHGNIAATYPRQSSVGGVGQIPARTECDCHYGGEFSPIGEALSNEYQSMVALTHELGHECLFYADFKDANGTVSGTWRDAGIPCFGGAHPTQGLINLSMFSDEGSNGATMSVMGGSLAGVYQANALRFGFSRVEMYFLGLASAGEVGPITYVDGGERRRITIDQVIAANGPRTPAFNGQMRVYRVPTFVVKRKGETISDSQLQQLQAMLSRWQSRFWRETGGRARANLTLDGGCSYTLSATEAKVSGAAARALEVFSENGCNWTATSNSSWITITAGSGSGNGQVKYSVAAEPNGAPRVGTITIAGQSVTISQVAPKRHAAHP